MTPRSAEEEGIQHSSRAIGNKTKINQNLTKRTSLLLSKRHHRNKEFIKITI